MPLPEKSYFFLPEIAARWDLTVEDLAAYAHDGILQVCVMSLGIRVDVSVLEAYDDGDWYHVPLGDEWRTGPQPLTRNDLWAIFRDGRATVTDFEEQGDERASLHGDRTLEVSVGDLIITRVERDRFETEYSINMGYKEANPAFIHNEDYSEVRFGEYRFEFGALQGRVVQLLHQASQTEQPWIGLAELLMRANAGSRRIVDLFKRQPHWRVLLRSDRKGRWRLNVSAPTGGPVRIVPAGNSREPA